MNCRWKIFAWHAAKQIFLALYPKIVFCRTKILLASDRQVTLSKESYSVQTNSRTNKRGYKSNNRDIF